MCNVCEFAQMGLLVEFSLGAFDLIFVLLLPQAMPFCIHANMHT